MRGARRAATCYADHIFTNPTNDIAEDCVFPIPGYTEEKTKGKKSAPMPEKKTNCSLPPLDHIADTSIADMLDNLDDNNEPKAGPDDDFWRNWVFPSDD